ncbi:tRNA (adenosine(37)-N6)-threonylcarbamoyltransferase complex transferase subunit TsaD [Magnetovibrio blakemorei]|uniref:tRNA N6-adenosine threonylcarbamoyltransferase n=1 Tax=Magnetovibrio blakemorei TaxID=28181 RepID=A0A1E5Q3S4_9PROT|nr:tRNA (adenosine(37)-N6)-threonylcarbamoyltransferase complex transferase subunit TsaD [Magnetovibrio blakemorei]OEJ64088.1 tRNA (adenosine(37)-N6)-threonylcarbamoyltransferase complex transferase subunit TsaD [Magnetovibrio blakemorei]
MIVLGIETSCDETAASVIRVNDSDLNSGGEILSDVVLSQIEAHRPFGGIVPEVAARAHLESADLVVEQAMSEAGLRFDQLDAVAATGGPGLIGGVIVGVMTAKAIAVAHNLPFIAVNHLEGHALTARLTDNVAFPYLLLLVSGGHSQLLIVHGVGTYTRLGTTIDDAVGEAFDKSAKLLGLGYPGGPPLEAAAKLGDAKRFPLPRPLRGKPGCHFSFSGLKAAVKRTIDALPPGDLLPQDVCDMAASFQAAVADVMAERTRNALREFRTQCPDGTTLVVAGGVAANQALRAKLEKLVKAEGFILAAPPLKHCTDNGAMIAWAGIERLRLGQTDSLEFAPRPRWPLDPDAPKAEGAGVKA